MNVIAPAKINLWLSVGKRRDDGYHEISSVMQAISLHDELIVEAADAITLDVEPPGSAPEDESNLVARAARTLRAATGASAGARIRLRKHVPMAAGLAGGSADAAATVVALNDLWRTGISKKALEKMGASLGADVPFCIRGGTALARGIGDDLSPLSCPETLWWVVVHAGGSKPSTRAVYEAFDAARSRTGDVEDPFELADALARGDREKIAMHLRNDLLEAAASLDPDAARGGELLRDAGTLAEVLTGSGPAWCGLARTEAHANEIASRVEDAAGWVHVARSLQHGARITA